MLRLGGAAVTMLGFRRGPAPDPGSTGATDNVIDLGRTLDGRFVQRAWSVARTVPRLGLWSGEIAGSSVILARNLEMLLLAALARGRYAPKAALVYECLDIHSLMLSGGMAGIALRQLERRLLRRSQGLVVSSPGFIREYFAKTHRILPRSLLVENKVLAAESKPATGIPGPPPGPPWRIGWFGAIRCRRSLDILTRALRSAPGLLEVIVAGKPARAVFPDGGASFRGVPGLTFLGPYEDEAALARLHASVHFAWTLDYYEAGGNSDWLLPNRLYRAALYGAVPIAAANTETGRWLEGHRAGLLLKEPIMDMLVDSFRDMTQPKFSDARTKLECIPVRALVTDPQECRELVSVLAQLGKR
jgi:succinoglycan biosynthesis protein ExoL